MYTALETLPKTLFFFVFKSEAMVGNKKLDNLTLYDMYLCSMNHYDAGNSYQRASREGSKR